MMFKNKLISSLVIIITSFIFSTVYAQTQNQEAISKAVSGLKMRSIGPAVMGGRIADIAVSHSDKSTWYVAAGSGGLWKTSNSGITWQPVFDAQASYSMGTVSIDPNNSNVIWVGTGENVSGRHVGWGDGVYKSIDAGKTWKNMGITKSEHIGKILIDPRNSDIVFVAAEGPLWSSGGDRGLYKTEDGGETWNKLSCDDLPKSLESEAAFAASDTNIAIVGDHTWVATGGKASRVLYSPDKGETWEVFNTPIIQGKETTGIYSIDFYDEQNGFAIGGDYTQPDDNSANKIRTKDGGRTWEIVGSGKEPGYRSCVQYFSERNGRELVVIGFNGIDYSNDGGYTWKHLSDEGFYTLRFLNDSTAYAAGKGRIAKLVFKE